MLALWVSEGRPCGAVSAMMKGDIVDRYKPCPICDRTIGSRGQYNHYMGHVRKGEMTVECDPNTALILRISAFRSPGTMFRAIAPYTFRLI